MLYIRIEISFVVTKNRLHIFQVQIDDGKVFIFIMEIYSTLWCLNEMLR